MKKNDVSIGASSGYVFTIGLLCISGLKSNYTRDLLYFASTVAISA